MRARLAWSVPLVVALLVGATAAQPRHERRTLAHVTELRQRLLEQLVEVPEADASTAWQAVASDLAAPDTGNPIEPIAHALARLRGVECDAAFLARASLMQFPLPEIIDLERYQELTLTLHLPYRIELPAGDVSFAYRILDSTGAEKARGQLSEKCGLDDLLAYQTVVKVPVAGWAGGKYRVEVRMSFGSESPRPEDPRSVGWFFIRRSFPATVQRLVAAVEAYAEQSGREPFDADLATLRAALGQIGRVYGAAPFNYGWEPAPWRTRALKELETVERMLLNVEWKRDLLHGLRGWVPLGTALRGSPRTRPDGKPGDPMIAMTRVWLPASYAEGEPLPANAPRPGLVVIVPDRPAWHGSGRRPTSPRFLRPGAMCDQLDAVGWIDRLGESVERDMVVAVMTSAGEVADAPDALRHVVASLKERFDTGPTVVLGERAGAATALMALEPDPALFDGVVLAAGGALGPDLARRMRAGPAVLAIYGEGDPGNENLRRAIRWLQPRTGVTTRSIGPTSTPWVLPLVAHVEAIANFVAGVMASKD